jgi:hypothetical protein
MYLKFLFHEKVVSVKMVKKVKRIFSSGYVMIELI